MFYIYMCRGSFKACGIENNVPHDVHSERDCGVRNKRTKKKVSE